MIRGIGNDIIEIQRIKKCIDRHGHHFINRLFTTQEQNYCYKYQDPIPHFAGRFAAKEAIVKALGVGFGKTIEWHDLEILNDELGKPVVHFSKSIQECFHQPNILVSIAHSSDYAIATAIWN